jgi:O-antigen/teichoic acid export membrane protein
MGSDIAQPRFAALRFLKHSRVVREGMWSGIGQVGSAAAFIVGIRLLTEMVLPNTFGVITLIMGAALLLKNMFCLPVMQALLRYHPEFNQRGELWRLRRVARTLVLSTAVPLVAVLILCGAGAAILKSGAWTAFLIIAALIALEVWRQFEFNILYRRQHWISMAQLIDAWARPLCAVAAVLLWGPRADAVLLGYLAGTLASCIALFGWVRREGLEALMPAGEQDRELARGLIRYAMPLVPLALIGWIISLSDHYIIKLFNDPADVGVYSAAYGLMSQPFLIVMSILSRTLTPVYFSVLARRDAPAAERLLRHWLLAVIGICAIGLVLVILLREWLAGIVLAEEYRGGTVYMPWIALGYSIYSVAMVLEMRFHATKQTSRILIVQALSAIAAVAAPLLFLQFWGVRGVAMACPVYFSVMAIAMWALSRRLPMAEAPTEAEASTIP